MNHVQLSKIDEMGRTYDAMADKENKFTQRGNTYCILRDICSYLIVYELTDNRKVLEKAMGFLTERAIHDSEPVKEFLVELVEVLAC